MSCIHKFPSCHATALGAVYTSGGIYRLCPNDVPTLMEVFLRYPPQDAYISQHIFQQRSNVMLGHQRCRNKFEIFE